MSRRSMGYLVTETIQGAHPHPSLQQYDLLEGDLLAYEPLNDTYGKLYPGIQIMDFKLSEAQRETLRPVEYMSNGLDFHLFDQ